MTFHRRFLLGTIAGVALGSSATLGAKRASARDQKQIRRGSADPSVIHGFDQGLRPDSPADQTARLQRAIDVAAEAGLPLQLQPGRYVCSRLKLRSHAHLRGVGDRTVIALSGQGASITATHSQNVSLQDLSIRGELFRDPGQNPHLLSFEKCADLMLERIKISDCPGSAVSLRESGGRVTGCQISKVGLAAVMSVDATGLSIDHNTVGHCHNNGILVWRSERGHDGTLVSNNRISKIAALDGGSGQNGNGINVFRADGVIVEGNHISDCAYSAVRGNSASNLQIVSNSVARLGEVAIYAEFAFQGAVIANNIVEHAATGVSVTNFNEGGRLAVVQGNVIRGLFRRENEPNDKRGNGIAVEADTTVIGNTIEGAPTTGISIGWHHWMRNVVATGNVVRDCGVGLGVSGDKAAGAALVSNNIFDRCPKGGIRQMKGDEIYGPDLANAGARASSSRLSAAGNILT